MLNTKKKPVENNSTIEIIVIALSIVGQPTLVDMICNPNYGLKHSSNLLQQQI